MKLLFCYYTEQEPANEEIDHLPMPAMEGPPMWDSRRKKRHVKMFSGATYVDAMQAFDVSIFNFSFI